MKIVRIATLETEACASASVCTANSGLSCWFFAHTRLKKKDWAALVQTCQEGKRFKGQVSPKMLVQKCAKTCHQQCPRPSAEGGVELGTTKAPIPGPWVLVLSPSNSGKPSIRGSDRAPLGQTFWQMGSIGIGWYWIAWWLHVYVYVTCYNASYYTSPMYTSLSDMSRVLILRLCKRHVS